MDKFKKITEEMFYNENFDLQERISEKIHTTILGASSDFEMNLEESLIECESPIEQLLAIKLEEINLLGMYQYNPFIDVIAIEKQSWIDCKKQKYRVDFLIPVVYKNQENKLFVIECDGHEFHQKTKEQVEKDNEKTRNLQKAGYEVIRFSGTEIWHKPYQCASEVRNIIMSKCKYIKDKE